MISSVAIDDYDSTTKDVQNNFFRLWGLLYSQSIHINIRF